ncbi:hypothetical protein SLEP1_g45292 [Rubroshorea leprosula]|uniref:Cyclin-dependent protein kinase inhibitor SMR6 n=1 Tax=Rubroshorea leprosula TaxID=152421 RepID=A0AAV5LII8_9ROSI|nr:hypothetical protein SLEP1_g45292 [Rubroshorea leprosula]
MGFPKKTQLDGGLDSEGKKWELVGIAIRTSLKPINTKLRGKGSEEEDEACSTTPTSMEARIPEKLPCTRAPRKRRPHLRCHYGGVTEFFTTSDLETIFRCHVEKAN